MSTNHTFPLLEDKLMFLILNQIKEVYKTSAVIYNPLISSFIWKFKHNLYTSTAFSALEFVPGEFDDLFIG